MSNASGWTTGASFSTVSGVLVTAGATTDAANNALTGLAAANISPLNTPIVLWGVLVKCTTGFGTPGSLTAPLYSYDSTTIS